MWNKTESRILKIGHSILKISYKDCILYFYLRAFVASIQKFYFVKFLYFTFVNSHHHHHHPTFQDDSPPNILSSYICVCMIACERLCIHTCMY